MHTLPARLTLARHGQTHGNMFMRANKKGETTHLSDEEIDAIRATHSMDERLTETGLWQAQQIKPWLIAHVGLFYDWYATSALPRAIETAIAIAIDSQWQLAEDLRERDHGLFDRMSPAEIAVKYPEFARRKALTRYFTANPGGEGLPSVDLRTQLWLQGITSHPNDWVLAVSHYETISVMFKRYTNMSHNRYHDSQETKDGLLDIPNASIVDLVRFEDPDDPFSETTPFFGWYRKVTPWDEQSVSECQWHPITQPFYSNSELKRLI